MTIVRTGLRHASKTSQVSSDQEAIKAVLLNYRDGLNSASVEKCVSLYASDGICMPQHQPASTGTKELNECYKGFFSMLKFDVEFNILEAHALTSEWGFARTTSKGTTVMVKSGQEQHEANQELFVMKKEGSEWRIARYCFCTTNPPH